MTETLQDATLIAPENSLANKANMQQAYRTILKDSYIVLDYLQSLELEQAADPASKLEALVETFEEVDPTRFSIEADDLELGFDVLPPFIVTPAPKALEILFSVLGLGLSLGGYVHGDPNAMLAGAACLGGAYKVKSEVTRFGDYQKKTIRSLAARTFITSADEFNQYCVEGLPDISSEFMQRYKPLRHNLLTHIIP